MTPTKFKQLNVTESQKLSDVLFDDLQVMGRIERPDLKNTNAIHAMKPKLNKWLRRLEALFVLIAGIAVYVALILGFAGRIK